MQLFPLFFVLLPEKSHSDLLAFLAVRFAYVSVWNFWVLNGYCWLDRLLDEGGLCAFRESFSFEVAEHN